MTLNAIRKFIKCLGSILHSAPRAMRAFFCRNSPLSYRLGPDYSIVRSVESRRWIFRCRCRRFERSYKWRIVMCEGGCFARRLPKDPTKCG